VSPRVSVLIWLLAALNAPPALAEDNQRHFYSEKERGWHWYEDPPPEKKPRPPPKPIAPPPAAAPAPAAPPAPAGPALFSTAWLRANLDRLRDDAIDHPDDKDKVRAYMYAQRVMLDKSQRFSMVASTVVKTDPLLDETNRVPMDVMATTAVQQSIAANRKEAVKYLASKGGLMFFFDSTCEFCKVQVAALNWLEKDYGYAIKAVSVDGKPMPGVKAGWVKDEGQAKALGLTIMPTTIFAVPPDKFFIISQGYHSAETLEEKILLAAEADNLLPEAMLKKRQTYERGVLKPGDLNDPALDPNDSNAWVEVLRKKLGARY
jgi:conjugal transfer pilus assembly protein TraF